MEIFGTPRPLPAVIAKWKYSWRETGGRVRVDSFNGAIKWLAEHNIPPIYYQFYFPNEPGMPSAPHIVFYKPEHEVYFKIHH